MLNAASYSMLKPRRSRWTLLALLWVGFTGIASAKSLSMYGYGGYNQDTDRMRHDSLEFYAPADRGCAMCRNGDNCSVAVHNVSAGVFCGDVLSTFQPCCCTFRNECMTTIFSDSCECFDGAREEEIMTTRFYLFVGLSFVAWALLVYDKMCAGPYKVMNSNHQLLATTPSAARTRTENSVVDTVDSDSEDERTASQTAEDAAAAAATAGTTTTASVTTASVATSAVAVEVQEAEESDDATSPLQPDSSSAIAETAETHIEVAVESDQAPGTEDARQELNESSIQSL